MPGTGDDQMIMDRDIQAACGIDNLPRKSPVGPRRLRLARRMIMNEKNCGRAYLDAALHDLPWIGVDMRYGAGRQHLICQYLINGVEEKHPQLFDWRECHGGAQIVQQCLLV